MKVLMVLDEKISQLDCEIELKNFGVTEVIFAVTVFEAKIAMIDHNFDFIFIPMMVMGTTGAPDKGRKSTGNALEVYHWAQGYRGRMIDTEKIFICVEYGIKNDKPIFEKLFDKIRKGRYWFQE